MLSSGRLARRLQLTTDGFSPYPKAVEGAFGANVDYAQLVKLYSTEPPTESNYSPPRIKAAIPVPINGNPNIGYISSDLQCLRWVLKPASSRLDLPQASLGYHRNGGRNVNGAAS